MADLLTKLLDYYSLSEDNFLELSKPIKEISLKDPSLIKGMDKIVNRIKSSINNKEKIIVYGDYDCDGVCATSIMVETFNLLDYPVSYYIPSRYIDGYGLNVNNVEKIAKSGFNLIICVDNGICANDAIQKANELGVDVIVIDHHEPNKELPNAYGIIHPTISNISAIIGSGGYMSLFVSVALLNRYDDYLVTLAGLSTISDLMELKDYNRDVVRLAIDNLDIKRYLPLRLLLDSPIVTEKSFSLEIAPKINAVGRIIEDSKVNRLVKYLTSKNNDEIFMLKDWIIDINEQRKELTKTAIECLPSFKDETSICLLSNMKEGLIGLMANRLLNQYNVPSIVFTPDEKDESLLRGSIRSKDGFNVSKAFALLDKYLVDGGGHALAGGLSIKTCDFDAFKTDFNDLCKKYPIVENNQKHIEIDIKDITSDNYDLIRKFAPFGMSFEEPLFLIQNLPTKNLKFISMGKHLSTPLSLHTKLLGFNMNESDIKSHSLINIYGYFNLSYYKDIKSIEYRINKYTY